MARSCPRCKTSLGDQPQCPTCGLRLNQQRGGQKGPRGHGIKWQQTAWGRTLIGLLLSQGIFYGLAQLVTAVILAANDEQSREDWWWHTLNGLIMLQALQGISLLAGGMVAGAGQRRGALYGTIVGVYNGFLFLLVYVLIQKHQVSPLELFGLPALQVAFGAVGGFVGHQIWKPIVSLGAATAPQPVRPGANRIPIASSPGKKWNFSGPVSWLRVLGGTALSVAGTVGATAILKALIDAGGEGSSALQTTQQYQFVTWEISVLAMIAGGTLAGSSTYNGIKQGFFVGCFSSLVLISVYLYQGAGESSAPAQTLAFTLLGIQLELPPILKKVIFTILSVLPLGLVGGWFGGQLLPPVIVPPRRKRMLASPM